ncbi:putative membrane protein YesL [Bacillus pakistanensis]|uniref:Membrane protein YesL n=1 Tax=Rossellomorea pakistanensis TaxID=992288 RepID=A0ABS2NDQ6_9BACI|nr:DUF624 domain-containing protein [Bacillus pakistanensis]MBM7585954.1 putative membrane protein YesL [Bacillus pakistanensis]
MNVLMERFYRFSEIIMKIALFQILWFVFSLCGLFILGILPATVGLYTVIRKWLMGNEGNRSLMKIYWRTFRKEFWKANAYGFALFSISFLLYLNFSLIKFTEGLFHISLLVGLCTLSILFIILVIYFFPVYVHFRLKKWTQYFTMSLLVGISFPFHTMAMLIGGIVLYMLFMWIPGLIPFFCVSMFALLFMWMTLKVFSRMQDHLTANRKNVEGFSNTAIPSKNMMNE